MSATIPFLGTCFETKRNDETRFDEPDQGEQTMSRSTLYLVLGALVIAAVVIGYLLYQERQKSGIDINVGKGGISIETK